MGDNANLFGHNFLDDHTAYMPFDLTKRVIWDPTEMEIIDTREESSLELWRGDLMLDSAGNRASIHFDGPVQQAFFLRDRGLVPARTGVDHRPSTIARHTKRRTRCPFRARAWPCDEDEEGYTYYGTWTSPITLGTVRRGAHALQCSADARW